MMIVLLVGIFAAMFGFHDVYAPTKIVPTEAAAPHPFTIIDAPEGRLVSGSVALFKMAESTTEISLHTNPSHKTAQGTLPDTMAPGLYEVSVLRPDAVEFSVGSFIVIPP
ncbi:MAG: hypothetical protein HMLIMOIP_001495 [Candidatus Nitrosomirales archaeon]|jgi:hypothetical protein